MTEQSMTEKSMTEKSMTELSRGALISRGARICPAPRIPGLIRLALA
jgi:hypothetical protein